MTELEPVWVSLTDKLKTFTEGLNADERAAFASTLTIAPAATDAPGDDAAGFGDFTSAAGSLSGTKASLGYVSWRWCGWESRLRPGGWGATMKCWVCNQQVVYCV